MPFRADPSSSEPPGWYRSGPSHVDGLGGGDGMTIPGGSVVRESVTAPDRCTAVRLALRRSRLLRSAVLRSAAVKSAWYGCAPRRSAPTRSAELKLVPN